MPQVRLLLCGAAGVGKTELAGSLKCRFLQSLFRRRPTSDPANTSTKHTCGFLVQKATIPGAGDFSVWDFSGVGDYYVAHEHFLHMANSIVVIVYPAWEPAHNQLAQVRFWLAMIQSKWAPSEVVRYAGAVAHKCSVVLVGSFLDRQQAPAGPRPSSGTSTALPSSNIDRSGRDLLGAMATEFGDFFTFPESVHVLDCRLSQSREMKALRVHLGSLRSELLKVWLL